MRNAIIFFNGDLSNLSQAKNYINKTDYIICADGGTRHALELNLKPNVIIGDFDSLSPELQKNLSGGDIEWVRYNTEKDQTDSELAIEFAIEKGFKTIILFGVFGTRLDHLLTNILSLERFNKQGIDITIIEGTKEIKMINKNLKLLGKIGDLVSLIPIKKDAKKITTKGLKYKLVNEDLLFGYSRGISNVFTNTTVEISLTEGSLLVIHEIV